MTFERQISERWSSEVPGTRWYTADLHLHTIDDHPGNRAKQPPGCSGDATDPAYLKRYARAYLQAAIRQGVEVLGLTPHAIRTGPGASAVWAIVDEWNAGVDEDGTPFRDRIFAVFPGFEPNVNFGGKGVHLIFLFDPEIGQDRFERVFYAVMESREPWAEGRLQMSGKGPEDVFRTLVACHATENAAPGAASGWNFTVLAPHAFSGNGLFSSAKGQVLAHFPKAFLAGIELPDNSVPAAVLKGREDWLLPEMAKHRIAFYHASDAYEFPVDPGDGQLHRIGSRTTLLKLGSPRIDALRQAFLGHEARLRLRYEASPGGGVSPRQDLPAPYPHGIDARPWLRSAEVVGGTSFHRGQRFRFSPDLTCVIGGSMTGKSTLLDGLRLHLLGVSGLPDARSPLRHPIEERARNGFLSGGAEIHIDAPSGDSLHAQKERVRPRFFGQGELKEFAERPERIEALLFQLVPGRARALHAQRDRLEQLDAALQKLAEQLERTRPIEEESEQRFERAKHARDAMKRFDGAGAASLAPARRDVARAEAFAEQIAELAERTDTIAADLDASIAPELSDPDLQQLASVAPSIQTEIQAAAEHAAATRAAVVALRSRATALVQQATARQQRLLDSVQQALIDAGGSANDLNEFDVFAKGAQNFETYHAALGTVRARRAELRGEFDKRLAERDALIAEHRTAMDEVRDAVARRFEGRVTVAREPEGRRDELNDWVVAQRQQGLSRWWNDAASAAARASDLRAAAEALGAADQEAAESAAQSLGMSPTVATRLFEALGTEAARLGARAIRCPDRFRIQWVEDGAAKDLERLSGGRKVAVLLTLLLEADDDTPLVVDQPEDELDNRFLNETIIPALHRLKGRRQVIFATHNANLVVNGDADQVIVLEADARHGRVRTQGTIEDAEVRAAIVDTLDGGERAFGLRRAKYGF